MNARTISIFIGVPPHVVYAFASNPANLPLWVPSFCKSVALVNDEWLVQSPNGPAVFAFVEANRLGVLDHTVTFPSGLCFVNPMRVVANGDGSELMFTLFQHEGMSEQQFDADAGLVCGDLQALCNVLESGYA